MKSLLILGCSSAKRPGPKLLPALDRYDGPLYRVLRAWQRENPDWRERLDVLVLSGRYGLIGAHVPIIDYDQRMTEARALELCADMGGVLRVVYGGPWASVYLSLGVTYRQALPTPLPWPAEFATGGIGERLAQLKAWLGGLS